MTFVLENFTAKMEGLTYQSKGQLGSTGQNCKHVKVGKHSF